MPCHDKEALGHRLRASFLEIDPSFKQAGQTWASYLASLCLSGLICRMRKVIIVPASLGYLQGLNEFLHVRTWTST